MTIRWNVFFQVLLLVWFGSDKGTCDDSQNPPLQQILSQTTTFILCSTIIYFMHNCIYHPYVKDLLFWHEAAPAFSVSDSWSVEKLRTSAEHDVYQMDTSFEAELALQEENQGFDKSDNIGLILSRKASSYSDVLDKFYFSIECGHRGYCGRFSRWSEVVRVNWISLQQQNHWNQQAS